MIRRDSRNQARRIWDAIDYFEMRCLLGRSPKPRSLLHKEIPDTVVSMQATFFEARKPCVRSSFVESEYRPGGDRVEKLTGRYRSSLRRCRRLSPIVRIMSNSRRTSAFSSSVQGCFVPSGASQ
jgi:hypothetical protein